MIEPAGEERIRYHAQNKSERGKGMSVKELRQRWLDAHKLSEQTRRTGDREKIEEREREEIELRTAWLHARQEEKRNFVSVMS